MSVGNQQQLEALGRLCAGIAHDFNNILSIIEGYANFARNYESGTSDFEECMDKIALAVRRGAGLTQQLLAFGQEKIMLDRPENIAELLAGQIDFLRPLVEENIQIEFARNLNGEAVISEVSADGLLQILMNLVTNARDAIGLRDGGKIRVRLSVDGGSFTIWIADNGEGIDPEIMDKMFDPFFTTKSGGRGTGLGLASVYGLVKHMQGEIRVRSRKGHGTVFALKFPLRKPDIQNVAMASQETVPHSKIAQKKTVLLSEDEAELLQLMKSLLEEHGLNVLAAEDGEQAYQLQESYNGTIDLLLTDVVMPKMNGPSLARKVRQVRPKTKIVFMSGYPSGWQGGQGFGAESVILPKPVRQEVLLQTLKNLLGTQAVA